ncbi:MAG: RNA 2',3'-cyclic phosphodiesterase [Candidatus Eisenbacteria bacterium]|nr:RNA 2',3'-cyclic phosphodiesterase [Candidatus Eisenbacteria bacterium]MCC7142557.1 RNA 2',3'-cyclic phosphodiesterase [Candidatus Eisenbacteria bacterium]
MTRVFLALVLPPGLIETAWGVSLRMQEVAPPGLVRWVPRENFHLTLRFFGDLDRARLDRALSETAALDGAFPAVTARLGTVSAFPSESRPSVLWIGLQSGGKLEALAAEVDRRLVAAGFGPADKPWKSHLTLGRIGREERISPPLARNLLSSGRLTAETSEDTIGAIALIESELRPQGARYTPLRTAIAARS